MDKKKLLMMGTAMVALTGLAARDAAAATAGINVDAEVITANAIAANSAQNLDFGTFTAGGGGTILINPVGGLGGTITPVLSSTPNEALVKIKSKALADIAMSIVDPTIEISNGTTTMVVDQFNIMTDAAGATSVTFNIGGTTLATVPIGARLTVDPGQAGGTYTGNFQVSVDYD